MLLSFALRAGRLEYQSLWYDEGSSLYLSRQSLPAITYGTAADIHPPLYYYLLHFWMKAVGSTEFGVRSLSVAAGLLTVAVLFALVRRLFGWRAGLLAALCGAAAPLAVYYSQETRMYAQVTLFGLLGTYLLVRLTEQRLPKPSPWLWAAYGASMVACLYSQYIGALVLGAHGVYMLSQLVPVAPRGERLGAGTWRWPAQLLPFALAAGAVTAVYLPWLYVARGSLSGWPSTDAFHAGPQTLADAGFRYVFGLSALPSAATIAVTALVSALVVAAVAVCWRQALLPVLALVVPVGAMFLLGYRKPIYNPKFALIALPYFLALLGAGIATLRKLWPLGLALPLAAAGYALANYYANPAFARDDYRGLAQFIQTSQRPGDAILLNAPGQEQIFPDYYHGGLPEIGVPLDRPLNEDATAQQLTKLGQQYQRLWLVLYGTNGSDPSGYVEHWLAGRDYEVLNQWFGNVRLAAFAAPPSQLPASHAIDATIGGFAHLIGYSLSPQPVASGDVLQLGLKWQAAARAPGDLKVFTHLIDGEGNIWAQRDSDPVGGARPTSMWKPGDTIDDNYGLLVLPGTPPGQYQVELGMYTAAEGKRLPVTAGGEGDRLLVGQVVVGSPPQPPSVAELRIPHPLSAQLGAIRLLGYSLTLVGQDTERTAFDPGDLAELTLFWEATSQPPTAATYNLQLNEPASFGSLPSDALANGQVTPQFPTNNWHTGDRYRDQHRLTLPDNVHGSVALVLAIGDQNVTLTHLQLR
ncbi:MAG: glycosyltransferase family 39 protein [Chloroflexi bacterium]|nr:glycosyltransferase family 39 protein [Chloroflexota bacterium]